MKTPATNTETGETSIFDRVYASHNNFGTAYAGQMLNRKEFDNFDRLTEQCSNPISSNIAKKLLPMLNMRKNLKDCIRFKETCEKYRCCEADASIFAEIEISILPVIYFL